MTDRDEQVHSDLLRLRRDPSFARYWQTVLSEEIRKLEREVIENPNMTGRDMKTKKAIRMALLEFGKRPERDFESLAKISAHEEDQKSKN